MENEFTIQELADCLLVPESMLRKMLNDAGANIDELANNPGELIPREKVINLIADHKSARVGIKLGELLRKG